MNKAAFQAETMDTVIEDLVPLLVRNHQEIDGTLPAYQALQFEPDFKRYSQMEEVGALRIFTARMNEKLVGYMILTVSPSLRYKDATCAFQEIFYIAPEHRGFGMSFLSWAETQLRFEGVSMLYQYTKRREDLYFGPVLERRGYHLIEEAWMKRLDL